MKYIAIAMNISNSMAMTIKVSSFLAHYEVGHNRSRVLMSPIKNLCV